MKKKTSRFRGVSYCKITKRFRADISLGNKSIYIGLYKTEKQAAEAYNSMAYITQGRKAKLNRF